MSSSLVGVDIGSTMVRVVEVIGVDGEGFAVISRIGLAPLPDGAVSAGRVKAPREVAQAMVRALKDAGVSRQGFVLGLTSPDVSLTTAVLPAAIRPEERENAFRAMGRSVSATFSIEESALSSYVISHSAPEDPIPTVTLGVAAALREDLDSLRELCDLARCAPRAIDLTGAALLRSISRVNVLAGEVGTVVDIGASKVTVATRQGMFLRSLRTTVGGGADITRGLANVLQVEFEEAEVQKMNMRLPASQRGSGPSQNAGSMYGSDDMRPSSTVGTAPMSPVELTLSGSADIIVDAIVQSIETDAAAHGSMTQGVSLCGGTALLRGLKDRVQSRLGVPVNIGRPWADLERSKRNAGAFVDGKPDPKLLLSLAPAVGLALWKESV